MTAMRDSIERPRASATFHDLEGFTFAIGGDGHPVIEAATMQLTHTACGRLVGRIDDGDTLLTVLVLAQQHVCP